MQFSQQVMETSRKYFVPKWREEIKIFVCRERVADRIMGLKPITGQMRDEIYAAIDSLPEEQIELMMLAWNERKPDYE